MPLNYLLDENLSSAVVRQVMAHNAVIRIETVQLWRGGALRGRHDGVLLVPAREEELTLVTCDLKTIPSLLADLSFRNQTHAGVIFIDNRSIRNDDFGGLTRALLDHWNKFGQDDWTNRVDFLNVTVHSS